MEATETDPLPSLMMTVSSECNTTTSNVTSKRLQPPLPPPSAWGMRNEENAVVVRATEIGDILGKPAIIYPAVFRSVASYSVLLACSLGAGLAAVGVCLLAFLLWSSFVFRCGAFNTEPDREQARDLYRGPMVGDIGLGKPNDYVPLDFPLEHGAPVMRGTRERTAARRVLWCLVGW